MKAMQAAVLLILRSLGIELKETVFFLTCLCLEQSCKQNGGGEDRDAERFQGYKFVSEGETTMNTTGGNDVQESNFTSSA